MFVCKNRTITFFLLLLYFLFTALFPSNPICHHVLIENVFAYNVEGGAPAEGGRSSKLEGPPVVSTGLADNQYMHMLALSSPY